MTNRQIAAKARTFRIMAWRLYVEMQNQKLPQDVRDNLRTAHDATCRAFMKLEDMQ
jgi:hypothetical protein